MPPVPPLIAVVDDNAFVHKAIRRLLRSVGFSVETYSSGAEFLESMRSHEPDCLVLDLHMPDVNGFDVHAHLRRVGATVPVVIMTGHDSPESRSRALQDGANAYICKPFDDDALLRAIASAMNGEHYHLDQPDRR